MTEQATTAAKQLTRFVTVAVGLPASTDGTSLDRRLRLSLRSPDGSTTRLVRLHDIVAAPSTDPVATGPVHRPTGTNPTGTTPTGTTPTGADPAGEVLRFGGLVAAGSHLLCADPLGGSHHFPPRTVHVGDGDAIHTFTMVRRDLPFFRRGADVVVYRPEQHRLAVVLHDADVDPGAVDRLVAVLADHRYHQVIDLTRRARTPLASDENVLEFAPSHRAAVDAGRLIRAAADLARRAEVAPGAFRLGRVVGSGEGRVVIGNECVVGFAPTMDAGTAAAQVAAAGGRIVEDLSDPADAGDPTGSGVVFVVRFDGADPEMALGLGEAWLADGTAHWTEPNLIEH